MRFTQAEVDAYEERKRASEARRRAGLGLVTPFSAPVREAQSPDVERPLCHASVEPLQRETLYTGRVSVRIISHRRRLCDPDGLVGKWFLDAARYARLIREDDAASITYEISQVKVKTKEEEGTEIIITPL